MPPSVVRLGAAALIVVGLALFGIEFQETMPDNALLVIDDKRKVYVSPPCMDEAARVGNLAFLASFESEPRTVTAIEVRGGKGYSPDRECVNMSIDGPYRDEPYGGFSGIAFSALRQLLDTAGIAKRPSRWRSDGSWVW